MLDNRWLFFVHPRHMAGDDEKYELMERIPPSAMVDGGGLPSASTTFEGGASGLAGRLKLILINEKGECRSDET